MFEIISNNPYVVFLLSATCATCSTSGTNWKVAVSRQEMMGMLRKLVSIVFQTHTIQICNQNLYILNTFVVIRYQIYN